MTDCTNVDTNNDKLPSTWHLPASDILVTGIILVLVLVCYQVNILLYYLVIVNWKSHFSYNLFFFQIILHQFLFSYSFFGSEDIRV